MVKTWNKAFCPGVCHLDFPSGQNTFFTFLYLLPRRCKQQEYRANSSHGHPCPCFSVKFPSEGSFGIWAKNDPWAQAFRLLRQLPASMQSSSAKVSPWEPAGICRPLCILQLKHHLVSLGKLCARNYWGLVAWYAYVYAGNLSDAGKVPETVIWFHVEQYNTLEALRVDKRSSDQSDVQFSLNIDLFIALFCTSLAFWPFSMCWVSLLAFQALQSGCVPASPLAARVHGEAALSPCVCHPLTVPHVRAFCISSLQESSYSRQYSQHFKKFQSKWNH